jgi:hypothetical protein
MLTIDGNDVTIFQGCERRWLLNEKWRVLRWRAHSLFTSCLRQLIFSLSNGGSAPVAIQAARTRFLSTAANPGLDLTEGSDPWLIAQDYCAMLATIGTALSRLTLLAVRELEALPIPSTEGEVSWQPRAWADESGVLHRWVTVDSWGDDDLARECHGWPVFGDIVMADAPLTLHVVEIGRQRDGRRQSPWARAFRHPMLAGRFRFQRRDHHSKGGHQALQGDWKPLWYADQPQPDPEAWVDLMDGDAVTPGLLHHIAIAQPSDAVRQDTLRQLAEVSREMARTAQRLPLPPDGMRLPMARGACDGWVPCPLQQMCYREHPEKDIGAIGLYQLRAAGAAERSSPPRSVPPASVEVSSTASLS